LAQFSVFTQAVPDTKKSSRFHASRTRYKKSQGGRAAENGDVGFLGPAPARCRANVGHARAGAALGDRGDRAACAVAMANTRAPLIQNDSGLPQGPPGVSGAS
jgi:hypothetical protein